MITVGKIKYFCGKGHKPSELPCDECHRIGALIMEDRAQQEKNGLPTASELLDAAEQRGYARGKEEENKACAMVVFGESVNDGSGNLIIAVRKIQKRMEK